MSGVVPTATVGSFASVNEIDFNSSSGLQSLLSVVRKTPMRRDEYNELRDLIIAFKQTGDDPAAKQKILELLNNIGLLTELPDAPAESEPVVSVPNNAKETMATKPVESSKPAAVTNRAGMSRPLPNFFKSVMTKVTAPVVNEEVKSAEEPTTAPVETITEAVVEEETPTPTPTPASEAPAVTIETKVEAPAAPISSVDPTERIKDIKREVNALVGNPVNLIDANNEIGREYMSALLDAMKKVNGQQSAEIMPAMERLEKAFVAVKGVNLTPVEKKEQVATVPVKPPLETQAEINEAPPEVEPAIPEPLPSETKLDLDVPLETVPTSEIIPDAGLPKSKLFDAVAPKPETESIKEESVSVNNTAINPVFTSVAAAKAEQTKEISETLSAAQKDLALQKKAEAEMDPLMTPEVTNGLNQLLSEWKLFKSSGIFGTGPSGAEHPLYKKLAKMQMSQVIAGRFEGATPEVKQNITDYMNGWRYEEGILHKHGETFEIYLRRVIRKILDKRQT